MTQPPPSLDTAPEVERRQIDAWRRMPAVEKAALVTGLTRAAFAMTAAGVRHRHPDATPREHFLRMAVIVLGTELARKGLPGRRRGDRPLKDAIDPIATAVLVSRHLDALRISHTIGGSIASSFAGEPRCLASRTYSIGRSRKRRRGSDRRSGLLRVAVQKRGLDSRSASSIR